jgi:excinuclease ABC subunit C
MLRRLNRARAESDLPDLFVIDGGKGQLSAALGAAEEFPDLDPRIVSLAKSRVKESRGETRAARMSDAIDHSNERVFLPGNEDGIELEVGTPEYRILTHLRDEAHRFAISHHRKRRKKVLHSSALDSIPGIGPSMRKKLFELFTDLDGIKSASFEQLRAVPGMREATATALYSSFRESEDAEPR